MTLFAIFIVLIFLYSLASGQSASLTRFIVEQLGYGTFIGVGIGMAGGGLLGQARR